ncbi:MAG TPA: YncE family protein [Gemmatirosa sp.]
MRTVSAFQLLAAACLTVGTAAAQSPSYHVTHTVRLGGEGGWDYLTVDTATNRLYISRGTHVMVVDLAHDSVTGDVANTPGVHGIAIAEDLGRGFTSNGRDSSVSAFDERTLAPIGRFGPTGANPDAIGYDPASKRVFTFNGRGENMTALDAQTGKVVGTVALGGKPEFVAVDGRGMLYVNNETTGELIAVNTRTLAVVRRTKIAGCDEPSGLAIDRQRGRLFVGCGNKVMTVHDAATGRQIATLPVGQGVDAVGFDAGTGDVFVSAGDGTLTVVRDAGGDKWQVAQTVQTKRGARTLAVDPTHHRVYVVTAEFGATPAATTAQPRPRPAMVPGSFQMLVVER